MHSQHLEFVREMSWQKCLSFSKCSNLEAKIVIHFKICHQRDKNSNYNLQKTEYRKQSFLRFIHLKIKIQEKFKLKTKIDNLVTNARHACRGRFFPSNFLNSVVTVFLF